MAGPYDIFPAVDSSYNFPPEIRTAFVQSTDVKAALAASPAFTGTPTAPTPGAGDNSTKVATTAYVDTISVARSRTALGSGTNLDTVIIPGMYSANQVGPTNAYNYGLLVVERSDTAVVQRYYEDGGTRSLWFRESYNTGSTWNPWNKVSGLGQQAVSAAVRDALTNVSTGAELLVDNGIRYRYNGSAWKEWSSNFTTYNDYDFFGPSNTPYERIGDWRYTEGLVQFTGRMTINASGNMSADALQIRPPKVPAANAYYARPTGIALYRNASDGYRNYWGTFLPDAGSNVIRFFTVTGGNLATPGYQDPIKNNIPFNEAWAQSDQVLWNITYEPA